MGEDQGNYSSDPPQYVLGIDPMMSWEAQGTAESNEHPIDLSMTTCT